VIERGVLADVMQWVPPGFGPFESYEADHTVAGGERLSLAGLDIEVIFTPGHSPGHVTYAIAPSAAGDGVEPNGQAGEADRGKPARALLSGDVLFQGPSGEWICRAVTGRPSSARSEACWTRFLRIRRFIRGTWA